MFLVIVQVFLILTTINCYPIELSNSLNKEKPTESTVRTSSDNQNKDKIGKFVDNRLKQQHVNSSRMVSPSPEDVEWITTQTPKNDRQFRRSMMIDTIFAVRINNIFHSILLNKRLNRDWVFTYFSDSNGNFAER